MIFQRPNTRPSELLAHSTSCSSVYLSSCSSNVGSSTFAWDRRWPTSLRPSRGVVSPSSVLPSWGNNTVIQTDITPESCSPWDEFNYPRSKAEQEATGNHLCFLRVLCFGRASRTSLVCSSSKVFSDFHWHSSAHGRALTNNQNQPTVDGIQQDPR